MKIMTAIMNEYLVDPPTIDLIDDLHDSRQKALHQGNRPLLERLRQHGVIGVGEHLGDN
jgi:hypothetical protein